MGDIENLRSDDLATDIANQLGLFVDADYFGDGLSLEYDVALLDRDRIMVTATDSKNKSVSFKVNVTRVTPFGEVNE